MAHAVDQVEHRETLPRLTSARPLVLFITLFPLWWLLGFGVLGFHVLGLIMALQLWRRGAISTPAGFGFMLAFLVWFVLSITVIYEDAPFAQGERGLAHLVPFLFNLSWFMLLAIVVLYIGNLREDELSSALVLRLFSTMFLITVVGGYLGMLLPHADFPSAFELVLPGSLRNQDFIRVLMHISFAEIQDFLGFTTARPRAPFNYTNTWGGTLGVTLPFFVVHWSDRSRPRLRRFLPIVLLLAVVPVVVSLNRGLWLGLALMAAFWVVRSVLRGHLRVAVIAGVLAAVGVAALSVGPAASLVNARLTADSSSNAGRSELAGYTVRSVLSGSPLLGFGTTRTLNGSFHGINGARTPECRLCAPPQMGTQGVLWYLLYAHGVLGLLLFIAFVATRLFKALPDDDPVAVAWVAAAVFIALTSLIYDLLNAPLFFFFVGLGLVWRRQSSAEQRSGEQRTAEHPVGPS